jgi:folate-binding protein YgfZ
MIALPYLSVIRFSGADAGEFLHNQLSADVLGLSGGESTWACYCEPKGRVLALLLVARVDDAYDVIVAASLARAVTDRMKIYVMRSKVEIEIRDDVAVVGSKDEGESGLATGATTAIALPRSGARLLLVAATNAPTGAAELVETWKQAELQQGICWLDTETSGQFLPQMLGFDALGAVNFKKGCYPGQEIVARTHYLGKVKRHPRLLSIIKPPSLKAMDKIRLAAADATDDAVLVDFAGNDTLGWCLLVVSRLDPGQEVGQIGFES